MNRSQIHNLVTAALCVALGVILPQAFHMIPKSGMILLPMHIPVLLCGLACGWPYGLACGFLVPILSSLLTGMPGPAMLPAMVTELAAYGLISGLMVQVIRTKSPTFNVYAQLVTAMLVGRVCYGLTNALIFSAGTYNFQIFFTAAFVTSLPGIMIQLIVLPPLLLLLQRLYGREAAVSLANS